MCTKRYVITQAKESESTVLSTEDLLDQDLKSVLELPPL